MIPAVSCPGLRSSALLGNLAGYQRNQGEAASMISDTMRQAIRRRVAGPGDQRRQAPDRRIRRHRYAQLCSAELATGCPMDAARKQPRVNHLQWVTESAPDVSQGVGTPAPRPSAAARYERTRRAEKLLNDLWPRRSPVVAVLRGDLESTRAGTPMRRVWPIRTHCSKGSRTKDCCVAKLVDVGASSPAPEDSMMRRLSLLFVALLLGGCGTLRRPD